MRKKEGGNENAFGVASLFLYGPLFILRQCTHLSVRKRVCSRVFRTQKLRRSQATENNETNAEVNLLRVPWAMKK